MTDPLHTLAQAVADGSEIDWDQAESSAASPDDRALVRQLRALAKVADVARGAAMAWGPLQIRAEVGSGSFGTVYRAWDGQLAREVALKILHLPPSATPAISSVIKEGRLLAQIRHPNVVTVYGADTFDGRVGIWTEFVNGRTLKEIVEEHGPLGARETALVGLDLCRALAAVHAQGFLHRDVKAQNVMREAGGRIVLMDFGSGERVDPDRAVTSLAGTPAYLAPEVAAGGAPDARSDLYSLGVLLFYLVSGEFPFTARSLDELKALHQKDQRRLLRDVRPDLPAAFVHAVDRATAVDPETRVESAGALEALLERSLAAQAGLRMGLVAAAAAAAAISVAGIAIAWRVTRTEAPRNSVVILPFKNLAADRASDYFSEGVAADIAAHLAKVSELRVISGAAYRDRRKTPAEIGAEVSAAAILDGSVDRLNDRVRIVGELIDAQTGRQIWSDTYERNTADIFAMQREVSRKIAIALKGELTAADAARLQTGRKGDFESFNLYLKGRYHWAMRTEDGFNRALQYFQDAVQRDQTFAPAYAGLADTYTLMGVYRFLPRADSESRARAAAERAIELDSTLAEAHASLGYVQKNAFQWDAAEQSFRRAIQMQPGYASAHQWYATLLIQRGRFEEAVTEIKLAMSQDPLSVSASSQFATILLLARRYDEAIAQAKATLQMESKSAAAHQVIAEAYSYQGKFDDALREAGQWEALSGVGAANQELRADLGYVYARSGRRAEAVRIADALQVRLRDYKEPACSALAMVYAALGESDRAFDWLSEAWRRHEPEIGYLYVDPKWDPVRKDPRFEALLSVVGFGPKTGSAAGTKPPAGGAQ